MENSRLKQDRALHCSYDFFSTTINQDMHDQKKKKLSTLRHGVKKKRGGVPVDRSRVAHVWQAFLQLWRRLFNFFNEHILLFNLEWWSEIHKDNSRKLLKSNNWQNFGNRQWHMCTFFLWSLLWSSLVLKKIQLLLMERSKSEFFPSLLSGVVVDDLPRPSITCHPSLGCSFICAHLQADDIFAFAQLLLWEISPVFLCFPAPHTKHLLIFTKSLDFYMQSIKKWLTYGTSWDLLCNSHHSLWQPNYPGPSGSSEQQRGLCLQTRKITIGVHYI